MSIQPEQLVEQAIAASEKAYAPYSNYHVGAALQTIGGDIYTGCNVENASYGLTVCAERNAIFKAVSEEGRGLVVSAIAVVTPTGASMCGACRQVLWEFGQDARVYLADKSGRFHTTSARELLPGAFGNASLED